MKLKGILGKGSGKLGSSVFAINGGEQIVREYNPRVSNPKTDAQIAQRAKFKLLSQLATVFGDVLGFKKMGLTSARNQFVSLNMSEVTTTADGASANLSNLLIAKGKRVLERIITAPAAGNKISAKVRQFEITDLTGVLFAFFKVDEAYGMRLVSRQLVTQTDSDGYYKAEDVSLDAAYAVYAYGIKFDSNAASQLYGNVEFSSTSEVVDNSIIDKILSIASGTTESVAIYQPFME